MFDDLLRGQPPAPPIRVSGAREHNLRNVDVEIPKRALTVVTGVSGSGKSSLAFDTIAAEASRQLHETLPAFVRGFLPTYGRPDVDTIDDLCATIVVDQRRPGGGPRSTVGTATDIAPLLRLLFSATGWPNIGHADAFSFNLPAGMCPACQGLGVAVAEEAHGRAKETAARPRVACEECLGARLNAAALACQIDGWNIAQMSAMEAKELHSILRLLDLPEAGPLLESLTRRVGHLVDIGLDYLSLDRPTGTLSGGEGQRVKIVGHLASTLTDLLYVFDEPSVGLHARDVTRLITVLHALRDHGNTVLVVEHDRAVISAADYVVDLGPGAGVDGGLITYAGGIVGLGWSDTPTGRSLHTCAALKRQTRTPTGWLPIREARTHNLAGIDVDVPAGVLTAVTGVAGSGKSSLVHGDLVRAYPEAIVVAQGPPTTNRRSTVATYTGVMDPIRATFARVNGVAAGLFSANSTGACRTCCGQGVVTTDLAFMEGYTTVCGTCAGRRFTDDVLAHRVRGTTGRTANIHEVLQMSAAQARRFFADDARIADILTAVCDIGLDYLRLGQRMPTLSGGEGQRITLASPLHRRGAVYVLDEPTAGLHPHDVERLLSVLDHLVDDRGATVVVIEHDLDVVALADWVIDLGPEGGSRGGHLLFTGTPRELLSTGSPTAGCLAAAMHRDDVWR